jgi:lysyl-tRNA synthetase class 2
LEDELIGQRRAKRQQWAQAFPGSCPDRYETSHSLAQALCAFGPLSAEELAAHPPSLRVAGRLIGFRKMGKLAFAHLAEAGARLQVLFERQTLGEAYEKTGLLDLGDWVGVEGSLFRTRTGELTLKVASYLPLQKCLRPLPEKWHGLQDVEQRYRQRHLDLIVNPESLRRFAIRHRMVAAIRRAMSEAGYEEVETPMLHPIAGGATARPFRTHHNALDAELFLRIAPELYLKRLVVGGMPRVFEINRNFRNEGIDTTHNPEFTMMEFYRAYASARDLMDFTEQLLGRVVAEVAGGTEITVEGRPLSFAPPFVRLDLRSAARKALAAAGVPEGAWLSPEGRTGWIAKLGMSPVKATSPERFLVEAFETLVEPTLWEPTFIHDYPVEVSPLSRRKGGDPETADRFELFVAGLELANGFSELNDADDQRERFRQQVADKAKGDEEAMPYDEDYCGALEYGLPPTAGEGLGIDRLAMILSDTPSIRDVVLFPLLKPRPADAAP